MCHAFLNDSNFYLLLYQFDQFVADDVQKAGCPFCRGVLHSAVYPRKPRGIPSLQRTLDHYDCRFSFCCATDGCRKRCTPPSVRFLGRKVYLSVLIVLVNSLKHKLTRKRQNALVEMLNIPPKTLSRWRKWWCETFSLSRCWKMTSTQFLPPIAAQQLPDELLTRLVGNTLKDRVCKLLQLISPVTTASYVVI